MTNNEKKILSLVASDLLTGNHLLGRPRSNEHHTMMSEFCNTCNKLTNNIQLTGRDIELITEMGNIFYGGIEDMCEQLGIDYNNLKKIL